MKNMNEKIENLRSLIGDGVEYRELMRLTYQNENVPSISTLRKMDLLVVVRMVSYEETLTIDEAYEMDSDELEGYEWDEDRELYVKMEGARYWGLR